MNDTPKLHAVIAIEKGVKARVYAEITELHKRAQKPEPFGGYVKSYKPRTEGDELFPPERKRVELTTREVLALVATRQAELFDVIATKDWGNRIAKADIILDGRVLLTDAPATYLLFLEKQLVDMRTFIDKMPVLDESEDWTRDPNGDLYKTGATITYKTRKVQRPLVLYHATTEHPAQAQVISEDVIVGEWEKVSHSGAFPVPEKRAILERIDRLLIAVKGARERANDVAVERREAGKAIFDYLFGS
jgi:hypothetical protein